MRKTLFLLLLVLLTSGLPALAQNEATPAPPTALIDALANALSGSGSGAPPTGATLIEYTQETVGTLDFTQSTLDYNFRGQAGDIIKVTVTSNALDPYVQLYNADDMYYALASGSGYANSSPARIDAFVLPQTGSYAIRVSDYYGSSYGSFTLSLDKIEVTPLEYGDTVNVVLEDISDSAYFSFDAAAGDMVNVLVTGDGVFDTVVSIHDPSGYEITYSDNAVTVDPAIENYVLGYEGTYMIILSPSTYGTVQSGEVELTLEKDKPLMLKLGEAPETLSFTYTKTRAMFAFEGEAGTNVRVNLSLVPGAYTSMSPNLTITQNGISLAYASGSYVIEHSVTFAVPDDGTVFVQIDEYSYTDVNVDVSVEEVE